MIHLLMGWAGDVNLHEKHSGWHDGLILVYVFVTDKTIKVN
ncbi:MAG TPA: hypothetical protein VFD80_06250 [Flavobacteriaceae bacterium]|nr:hypothetical protein [Flavobacteriaceae bacterium]